MSQSDDLSAAVAANTAAVNAIIPAIDAEIADVSRLLALLEAGPAPDPAVAQAIADVQASTAALAGKTSALQADDPATPPA